MPHRPTDCQFDALEPRCLLAFTVTNLNDAGAGSLRQAVLDANAAGGADVIDFQSGLSGTITLGSALIVSGDLTLTGPGEDNLTLSGGDAVGILNFAPGVTASVSGLTISGGADSSGAILNAASLTLNNVTVSDNNGANAGAIFSTGSLFIDASTFEGNSASDSGAGGAITGLGAIELEDSVFTANTAPSGVAGAVSGDALITIVNCIFSGNSAGNGGGAVYSQTNSVISNSTFSGNTGIDGGGILAAGILDLSGSTLSGNQATRGGGLFITGFGGTSTIQNTTISGNTAGDSGGGIFNVTGNTLHVDSSTIAGNTADPGSGGGILSNGTTRVRSTIIGDNTGGDFEGSASLDGTSTFNLIESSSSAGGLSDGVNNNIVGSDPMLGALANNGGPTFTRALLVGSPAIDAGANPASLSFDQRGIGFARDTGDTPDIGAFEFSVLPTIADLIPSATSVARGASVTITASAVTAGGSPIARVEFYRDANDNGVVDSGEFVSSDTNGDNGYRMVLSTSATLALPLGSIRYIAIAFADDATQSVPVDTEITITNAPPTLGALTPSAASFEQGQPGFILTAGTPADADGNVTMVRFYADLNGDGIAQGSENIGTDTDGSNGFSTTLDPGLTLEFPSGPITFLSIAVDSDGGTSAPSSTTATALFSLRAGEGRQVVGTANAENGARVGTVNLAGDILVFEEGWIAGNLQLMTGAPRAIGDAVIWVDPRDNLTYVAVPSSEGLLLFTHLTTPVNMWTVRNLSTETGATSSPTHGLTQFISTGGTVVISGLTAEGRIVAFQVTREDSDTGGPGFDFLDISSDLESQGMQTPDLESLISYVPTWDSWHLAGIDADGRIQSVWINTHTEGFTKWRTDDLTSVTGAPAITGQLAVTLTSWGGINLTGLNDDGNLLTTWWVPEFGGEWRVNNLTEQFGGSPFVNGNVSGYTTPWGGLNYVGLNEDGRVVVYWWAPAVTDWSVTPLLPESVPSEDSPRGKLTSSASAAGTLNVYGAGENGDVFRLSWSAAQSETGWTAENLSELATRQ